MSVTIVISLKVADFADWHVAFDSKADDRAQAGLSASAYKNTDDPNNAIVIGSAPSKEAFVAFFTTPEVQKLQKKAGVLGPPEIKFLEEA